MFSLTIRVLSIPIYFRIVFSEKGKENPLEDPEGHAGRLAQIYRIGPQGLRDKGRVQFAHQEEGKPSAR